MHYTQFGLMPQTFFPPCHLPDQKWSFEGCVCVCEFYPTSKLWIVNFIPLVGQTVPPGGFHVSKTAWGNCWSPFSPHAMALISSGQYACRNTREPATHIWLKDVMEKPDTQPVWTVTYESLHMNLGLDNVVHLVVYNSYRPSASCTSY